MTTLGLWLLFQPREDSASLLLTQQGRFICWGRGQEAQPGAVRAYLGQVVCFLLLILAPRRMLKPFSRSKALLFGGWTWILRIQTSFFLRGACLAFGRQVAP